MSREENLAAAYSAIGIPLDRLPYTEAMDRLVASVNKAEDHAKTHHQIWLESLDLRKGGKLPKVGRIRRSEK
jgi:hypothetical protein